MELIEDKIYRMMLQLCSENDIYLQDVAVTGAGKNRIIKVIVDTESGITVNECQEMSRKFSDLFYRKNIYNGMYQLEVSSPGTNKPIEFPYEFRRNIGRVIEADYLENIESKKVIGQLVSFDGDFLKVKGKEGNINIPLKQLKCAKVKLQW